MPKRSMQHCESTMKVEPGLTLIEQAVEFARSVCLDDIPQQVMDTGKWALIDCLGGILAGQSEQAARSVANYVQSCSTRSEASIFGTSKATTRQLAALTNGVAGHALDYDDTSWTTIGHPTVTVAPAALAMGEMAHVSGKQLLRAYAIGVEVQNKIGGLAMPETSSNGWHTTSVFGPLGAATASALIAKLSRDQFVSAIGLAASMAGGIRANFGTLTKAYHAGMAAQNGVKAVLLAQHGLTAAANAMEAQDGFLQVFTGKTPDTTQMAFGNPWELISPGLVFKRYPNCSGTHPAVDSLFRIMDHYSFTADDVVSLQVGVGLLGLKELTCHSPSTAIQARFSMEYAMAAAIVFQKLGLDQFSDQAVSDSGIRKLIPKIRVALDDELAELGFIGTSPAKLRISLKDGRELSERCDLAMGNPEKPLSDNELSEKFIDCASRVFQRDKCREILECLTTLERIRDINTVTSLLKQSASKPDP